MFLASLDTVNHLPRLPGVSAVLFKKLRQIYIKFLWGRNNTLCDVLITEFIFTCKNVLDIRSRIPYYGKLWVTLRVYRNLIQDYTDINMHCQRRLRSALPECPLVKQ